MSGVPAPGTALPADQLAALERWLPEQGVAVAGALRTRLITGGKSNLTYELRDDEHRWVLRRPPLGGYTPSAHDVAREFRVTSALASTDVPVAASVAVEPTGEVLGAPFTVVAYVEGASIRTGAELDALAPATVEAALDGLVSALAALHRVDHVAVGLESFGRPDAYAARQLRRWSGQWDLVGGHATPGAARAAAELVERLGATLPPQRHTAVVHGDYRIDNTLLDLDTGRVAAVVDWELSTIGDPVADVALMGVYRDPTLDVILGFPAAWTSPSLPDPDALGERYEAAGGVPLDHWDFWMALGGYKLAVISAGIDHRFRAGGTVGDGFDTAGDAVEPLLVTALDRARRASA